MYKLVRLGAVALAAAALSLSAAGAAQAGVVGQVRDGARAGVVTNHDGTAGAMLGHGGSVTSLGVRPAGGSWHGCPYGAVCVYPEGAGLDAGPEAGGIYWSYGYHNLHNQFGMHWVLNNQYDTGQWGGVWAWQCYGYNGTGGWDSGEHQQAGIYLNLTPINSIVLTNGWPLWVCGENT